MKRTIIVALLAFVAMVGQGQENKYTVKGKVDNANTKVVYLSREGGDSECLDSAKVSDNGEFVFTGNVAEPIPVTVFNKEMQGLYCFILEPGNITFRDVFMATGSALNDSLTHLIDYAKSLGESLDEDAAQKQFAEYAKAMFLRHKNDALGLRILDYCGTPSDKFSLYNMAGPMIKAFPRFVKHKDTWAKYDATSEGKMMLDIESAVDGKKLSDYVGKGKYVLVDFWASSCGPCRQEIPNIIAAYNKYGSDKLQVLGLACWEEKEDTDQAIKQLHIPYPQIYGLTKEQTNSYGVTGIPHIIIFAPDGKVLKRGLRGENIEKELKKIFGE